MMNTSKKMHRAMGGLIVAGLGALACGRGAGQATSEGATTEIRAALTQCSAGQVGALLCDGVSFADPCTFFPLSGGNQANLGTMNDKASSARSCGGASYTLFVDPGFAGSSQMVAASQSLATLMATVTDRASSLRFAGGAGGAGGRGGAMGGPGGRGGAAGGAGGVAGGAGGAAGGAGGAAGAGAVDCSKLVLTGSPVVTDTTMDGATWTYQSTDGGSVYDMRGILLQPSGSGPFPAIVVSHGKMAAPEDFSRRFAKKVVVPWGAVVIGPQYSHAVTDSGLPFGADGSSPENIARAFKARQLLSCISAVDVNRVAAHGHSMGAYVTGALVATHPTAFMVASHMAGGACPPGNACTSTTLAAQIVTPYQMNHGDNDCVVRYSQDETLDSILATSGTDHHLIPYAFTRPMCDCNDRTHCMTTDHVDVTLDDDVYTNIHTWYTDHGLFN